MTTQRRVEMELLRLSSAPKTLGVQDSLDMRLYALGMLYRLGLINDETNLSLSVSLIKDWDKAEKPKREIMKLCDAITLYTGFLNKDTLIIIRDNDFKVLASGTSNTIQMKNYFEFPVETVTWESDNKMFIDLDVTFINTANNGQGV